MKPEPFEPLRDLAENGRAAYSLELLQQGWGSLMLGQNLLGAGPLKVGDTAYGFGLATHSPSRIRVHSREPLRTFRAVTGIERNANTDRSPERISPALFSVEVDGRRYAATPPVRYADGGVPIVADLGGATVFDLVVDSPEGLDLANVDWCAPEAETASGHTFQLGTDGFSFAADTALPVDFRFGQLDAAEFYLRYGVRRTREERGDHTLHTAVSGDATAGLRLTVTMKLFHDLPVLEYRVAFENPTEKTSVAHLSHVDSLRLRVAAQPLRLLRRHGSFDRPSSDSFAKRFLDSFTPAEQSLKADTTLEFGATAGRPSVDWLPCFDLADDHGKNLRIAIGWAGQWHAKIACQHGTETLVCAGIEDIDLELQPGERLQLPSIALVWNEDGGTERAVNLWRRYLREKIQPRIDGHIAEPPLSCINWGGMTEQEHLDRIANIATRQMPFQVHWIDAGWYGPEGTYSPDEFDSAWSRNTGDWKFNPTILPQKLRNIAAATHAAGMRQLLWIEPERAVKHADIVHKHPEFFLPAAANGDNLLLNLGHPQAWQWCFDTLANLIEENSLDILRIDFNISPLAPWRDHDAPTRRGASEIHYVNGLYRLWNAIRERFPHVFIDNCASGGRRLEFEALRYSLPLWASDMECADGFDPEWQLTHVAGLSHYLPAFSLGLQNQLGGDTYNFRASMGPGLVVHYFTYAYRPLTMDYPHDWLKARLDDYLRVKDCFSGDYYCLDAFHADTGNWTLLQFDRPDLGRGLLEAFRSVSSPYRVADVRLRGLAPDATYRLEDMDSRFEPILMSGKELMDRGLAVELPEPRSSCLILYQCLSPSQA